MDIADVEKKANDAYEAAKKDEYPNIKLDKEFKNFDVMFYGRVDEKYNKQQTSITLTKIIDYQLIL